MPDKAKLDKTLLRFHRRLNQPECLLVMALLRRAAADCFVVAGLNDCNEPVYTRRDRPGLLCSKGFSFRLRHFGNNADLSSNARTEFILNLSQGDTTAAFHRGAVGWARKALELLTAEARQHSPKPRPTLYEGDMLGLIGLAEGDLERLEAVDRTVGPYITRS